MSIDNVLFSEKVKKDGEEYTITATTDDTTFTIIKKALDIEFKGDVEVYQTEPPEDYEYLPDTYIQTFYNGTDFVYANNQIASDYDEYSIYVITRKTNEIETLCKRVCKTLNKRGFCITDSWADIESSDGDGYIGKTITVTLYR